MVAPATLVTARLTLVPPGFGDVDALVAHWRDPDVRRYLWDDTLVEDSTVTAVVAQSESDHAEHGWGGWTVRVADELIGWCGLRVGPPDSSPVAEELLELVYSVAPHWWHCGIAVEAAGAVLDHVFGACGVAEVWAGVDPPNARSSSTLDRLGFAYVRDVVLDVGPTPYSRCDRADWLARRRGRDAQQP